MSIRIRTVNGVRVAICAAVCPPLSGDLYLDDADHYALARKFSADYGLERRIETPEGRIAIRFGEPETVP